LKSKRFSVLRLFYKANVLNVTPRPFAAPSRILPLTSRLSPFGKFPLTSIREPFGELPHQPRTTETLFFLFFCLTWRHFFWQDNCYKSRSHGVNWARRSCSRNCQKLVVTLIELLETKLCGCGLTVAYRLPVRGDPVGFVEHSCKWKQRSSVKVHAVYHPVKLQWATSGKGRWRPIFCRSLAVSFLLLLFLRPLVFSPVVCRRNSKITSTWHC